MSDVPIYPKKAWTMLVFMAGDNDLEAFAHLDLAEMDSLPSDEHLHVVVQFDSRAKATYRFRFFPGGHEKVGQPLGEVNTGDPASLTGFVTWGKKHFPAAQTALVIWNHGTGLRDLPPDFDYSRLRSGEAETVQALLRRTLFNPTLAKLAQTRHQLRGVAIDATDRDYLDNQELQKALSDIPGEGPRIDLLGFDACLMNVVEIGYQLRSLARFMVGSQETEPGAGWPYNQVLTALVANPDMSARQLGETVVKCYARSTGMKLRQESPFTQSVLDLGMVDQTFNLVRDLALALDVPFVLENSTVEQALRTASESVKRFHDRDLADLSDWCAHLVRETKGGAGDHFRYQLLALQAHLELGAGLVIANIAHGGSDADHIHGVSIYWPQTTYSSVYDSLEFAVSGWGRFVNKLVV